MAARYKLTLFVKPENSGKGLARLYTALENVAYTDYELRIIDVNEEPKKAKKANIFDTPTLIYHSPDGDVILDMLADVDGIRKVLGLSQL